MDYQTSAPNKDLNTGAKDKKYSINGSDPVAAVEEELKGADAKFKAVPNTKPAFESKISLEERLLKHKVNPSLKINEPPVCIEIIGFKKGSTITGFEYFILCTLGNFSAVIGKAKSRKTFLVLMFLAGFIANKPLFGVIKCRPDDKKNKALLFDTEQSVYHVHKGLHRILALADLEESPNLEVYCLRTEPPKSRLELIRHKIYNTPGLGLVIIDGVKDLAFDINDGKEATEVTTELMKWSEELNCHIMVVLHQNKGDNNARGHLGTEVVNKAETVISVVKDSDDQDMSIVSPEYCREKEFPPFSFKINSDGIPYIINDWQPKEETRKEQVEANNIPDEFHKERLKEAFKIELKPSYKNLWTNIQTAFAGCQRVGDSKAKRFVSYYQKKEWIKKIEPPESGRSWAVYALNLPV